MTNHEQVLEFSKKFGIPTPELPQLLGPTEHLYRTDFMIEELQEYNEAWHNKDIVKAADALADLVYVALGTAIMMGLPWQKIFDEVHRCNMTKMRKVDMDEAQALRHPMLDVGKPEGWVGPEAVIEQAIQTALNKEAQ